MLRPLPNSRWLFAGAVGLLALLHATAANAFPSATLIYVRGRGAESCPGEMEVRLSVAHRLGYDPFNAASGRTMMTVIESDGQRLIGRLELVDKQGFAQGERQFEAALDHCADLVRALALSMSIAIDPDRTEVDELRPAPRLDASRGRTLSARDDDREERPTGRSVQPVLRLGIGGQAAVGVAPATVAGALIAASLRRGVLSLGLELRADATGSRKVPNGASVQSGLIAGSIMPCFHYDPALFCAMSSWGRIQATSDAARALEDTGLFWAAGLRLGTEWSLGSLLLLRTHTDLLATLVPVRVALDRRDVWELPPITGSFGATLFSSLP